jgi:ribonuclease Z
VDLDVLFLGTAGSAPTARRGLPATLLRRGGERLLFDCGEGTQRQLVRSIGLVPVDEIYLTHFHADHVLGLPGLLKTYSLHGRDVPLTVHGPRGLERLFSALAPIIGRLTFEVELREGDAGEVLRRDGYSIAVFAADHGVSAHGYALIEEDRPGAFDADTAAGLGLTPGPDFGRVQRGESVGGVTPDQVMGPPRRGRKVVLSGDTAPSDLTRAVAFKADLLVHEATFAHEEADRAAEVRHTTARQAGEIAAAAEVELLAINHVSSRYPGRVLQDEARAAFEQAILPRDFDRVEIPFPERGPPAHVRAEDAARVAHLPQ